MYEHSSAYHSLHTLQIEQVSCIVLMGPIRIETLHSGSNCNQTTYFSQQSTGLRKELVSLMHN